MPGSLGPSTPFFYGPCLPSVYLSLGSSRWLMTSSCQNACPEIQISNYCPRLQQTLPNSLLPQKNIIILHPPPEDLIFQNGLLPLIRFNYLPIMNQFINYLFLLVLIMGFRTVLYSTLLVIIASFTGKECINLRKICCAIKPRLMSMLNLSFTDQYLQLFCKAQIGRRRFFLF